MKSLVTTLIAICLVSGCVNPIQRRASSAFAEGCYGFQVIGKWVQARSHCERAVRSAIRGNASQEQVAALWLEYGRASGVTCNYADAEFGLQEAFELNRNSGGPAHLAALELARLMMVRHQPYEAIEHYETFWSEVPGRWIDGDPVAAAEVFEEQANALRLIGDDQGATEARRKAQTLRADNPYAVSNSNLTPYGAFCL